MNVLVSIASQHGATEEIGQAIARTLRARGLHTVVIAPERVHSVDQYDAVVLGSAVYAGHWMRPALEFAERFGEALRSRKVWLFSSGPVGDPSRKLVQQMGADPADIVRLRELTKAADHRVFAGRLDPEHLTRPQRASLLVFRGMRGDFRDWTAIEQWAEQIADALAHPAP